MPPPTESHVATPSARQFVNDIVANHAFETGEPWAQHVPVELHLQLASGCNLDCYMCSEHLRPESQRHGRGLRSIDREIVARLERDVFPAVSRLHLGVGGEPMLAPDFLEIVERAHARSVAVHLTTNGTRIATERVAEVLARCTTSIEISVDGATRETYERIRSGASFARLEQNVALLQRHRRMRRPEARPRLSFCMVLLGSNVGELPRLVELAARLGVDAVSAWPVIPVTPEGRADLYDAALAQPFLEEARERARQLGIELDLPFASRGLDLSFASRGIAAPRDAAGSEARDDAYPRSEAVRRLDALSAREPGATAPGSNGNGRSTSKLRLACHMPTLAVYVLWDGRVYPCSNPSAHAGEPLGDLSRQSFAEVWNGPAFRNLRAGLAHGDAPETCRRCPILHPEPTARAVAFADGEPGDLVSHYAGRAPAAAPDSGSDGGTIDRVVASGLAARIQAEFTALRRDNAGLRARVAELDRMVPELALHARTIEAEREHLVLHAQNLEELLERWGVRGFHRWFGPIKGRLLTRPARPTPTYVPPWVADGTRQPGESVSDVLVRRPLPVAANGDRAS